MTQLNEVEIEQIKKDAVIDELKTMHKGFRRGMKSATPMQKFVMKPIMASIRKRIEMLGGNL